MNTREQSLQKCNSYIKRYTCYHFLSPLQKLRVYFLEYNRNVANKKCCCYSRAHQTTTNNSDFSNLPGFQLNISYTWHLYIISSMSQTPAKIKCYHCTNVSSVFTYSFVLYILLVETHVRYHVTTILKNRWCI